MGGRELGERIAAAFTAGDVEAFAACFAEDAVQRHPMHPEPIHGRDGILAAERPLFDAFSEITYELQNVVDAGEWVTLEALVSATNTGKLPTPGGLLPPTGKRISLPMASIVRLDASGDIAEEHRYLDVASFMAQLGLMGG